MSDKTRPVSSPPPEKKLARQRRTIFLAAAASVAVVAVVGCIVVFSGPGNSLQHKPEPAGASGSPAPTQHSNSALTDQEYAFARDLVRSEIRQQGAILTSATVTMGSGKVIDSNIGYPCTSGRLLYIKLIGDFPHTTHGGLAEQREPHVRT